MNHSEYWIYLIDATASPPQCWNDILEVESICHLTVCRFSYRTSIINRTAMNTFLLRTFCSGHINVQPLSSWRTYSMRNIIISLFLFSYDSDIILSNIHVTYSRSQKEHHKNNMKNFFKKRTKDILFCTPSDWDLW